jgi:probable HAF family extracellular repeat protein
MMTPSRITATALVLAATSFACAEPGFWMVGMPPGGQNGGGVRALSADGSVAVGANIVMPVSVSFRWTREGGRNDFGAVAGSSNSALGISGDGTIIVGAEAILNGQSHTYRRVGSGPFEDLGYVPNYARGRASGVSRDGSIVVGTNERGQFSNVDGQAFRWTPQTGVVGLGFLRTQGTYSEALAISQDGTTIVGNSQSFGSGGPMEAYYWREGVGMQALPGLPNAPFVWTRAYATNADGRFVVGSATATTFTSHAMRWATGEGFVDLGTYPGYRTAEAVGVSDNGRTIVGGLDSSSTLPATPFVWTEGVGMELMSAFLARNGVVMPEGVIITRCNAISGDGLTFAGIAFRSDLGSQGFVATIPAPSAMLVMTALVPRRRRVQQRWHPRRRLGVSIP